MEEDKKGEEVVLVEMRLNKAIPFFGDYLDTIKLNKFPGLKLGIKEGVLIFDNGESILQIQMSTVLCTLFKRVKNERTALPTRDDSTITSKEEGGSDGAISTLDEGTRGGKRKKGERFNRGVKRKAF